MYNVIKSLNSRRSPDIDLTKIAVVYDTTVSGELELCQAYMEERNIPSTHLYGIALGTTYDNAAYSVMRPAFLTALGDYFVTNSIEMVAVGPNSPLLIGDGGYDNLGTSFSSLCGQALKQSTLFRDNPVEVWNANQSAKGKIYYPTTGLSSSTATDEVNLSKRASLEAYNYIKDEDELIEVGGIDIDMFQSQTGGFKHGQIAIDQGRVQDINGNSCAALPCFRIGFHKGSNGNVSITPAQIRTMVQNSKALANTRAYHKANTNVSVIANQRTTRITNHSATYAHYLTEQAGYTNTTFGYRSDASGIANLSTIGANTGLTKYNGTTTSADVSIDKFAGGGTNTTTSRTPNYNGYLYSAHNGTTFPITSGLILDTASENPQAGGKTTPELWTSGSPAQIFELETGAIIQTTTSHCLAVGASQILNGAGALIGSYYEPSDAGVGNGCDTLQYLLKGYDAATAKMLDWSYQTNSSEVWGDGLTQFVNDVPVISNEETLRSLTVPFTSLLNAIYGITGSYENSVGQGSMVVNAFAETNLDLYDYKISGYCDVVDSTIPLLAPDATTGGFTLVLQSASDASKIVTTLAGQLLPFDSVRITDVLDPARLDRIITKEEFGVGYSLAYATGGVYVLDNEYILEGSRDYTIQFNNALSFKYEVLDFTRLPTATDTVGAYAVNSLFGSGEGGFIEYLEFEDSATPTFYPSSTVIKDTSINSVIPTVNSRNTRISKEGMSFSTPQLSLSVEQAEEALVQAQADLADAIANAGSGGGSTDTGVTQEYINSTNLPSGRDFGTKRYQNDGDIIPNYIHTDFPNR